MSDPAEPPPDLMSLGRRYHAGGLALLPIGGDKRPFASALPRTEDGRPTWTPLRDNPADLPMVERWCETRGVLGLAVICGQASGGLLVLDIDVPRLYDAWKERVGILADALPVQRTGGGGFQVAVRCERPGGNVKLAWVPDDAQESGRTIGIETRGEGGYAVLPGSRHPSGNYYVSIANDFGAIPVLQQSLVDFLLHTARTLCEAPFTRQQMNRAKAAKPNRSSGQGANIIEEWNRRVPIREMLVRVGYVPCGPRFTRPGVDATPAGVTILDECRSYHFSSNDPLCDGHAHDSFSVFCELEHDGDVRSAVKAAAAELGVSDSIPPPSERERGRIAFSPIPASQLGPSGEQDWVWHGFFARGFVTLLIGLWKSGKSTLIAYVLKLLAEGGVLISEVKPARALVISEEGAGLWAERRDNIGIGDNVFFAIRPFKGRPSSCDWEALVEQIADMVEKDNFDLVVFDTWASVSPCPDENDAAGMMAALRPLYKITAKNAAVLLIHHPRKSEGTEGQASRGSGALPGFVDCILEFRRFEPSETADRRRVLKAYSRFEETPSEMVVELKEDGYETIGTKAVATQEERFAVVEDLLRANPQGLSSEAIRENWPNQLKPSKSVLASDLKAGMDRRWQRRGNGKKGDPFVWFPFVHEPNSSGGNESEREESVI